MVDRISTLDDSYQTGDLSVYPSAIDDKESLYEAKNNAETTLTQTLSFSGVFIIVEDTASFPAKGLIRVGNELIYYDTKATGIFKDLKRGFAGSVQQVHSIGTKVSHAVMAEHHNACKDAIHNIETFVGLENNPATDSFHGKLKALEAKHLAPKPLFRAFPRSGQSPLQVRFQNFSNKDVVRFLWDFGDGAFSNEDSPQHTYLTEGDFTVQLRMVTGTGGSGVITKSDYIKVRDDKGAGFMYVTPESGTTATTFTFVDQTDGDIIQRHWNFGDTTKVTESDPDIHTITHTYSVAGTYDPTLLVVFADQTVTIVRLSDSIVVA